VRVRSERYARPKTVRRSDNGARAAIVERSLVLGNSPGEQGVFCYAIGSGETASAML